MRGLQSTAIEREREHEAQGRIGSRDVEGLYEYIALTCRFRTCPSPPAGERATRYPPKRHKRRSRTPLAVPLVPALGAYDCLPLVQESEASESTRLPPPWRRCTSAPRFAGRAESPLRGGRWFRVVRLWGRGSGWTACRCGRDGCGCRPVLLNLGGAGRLGWLRRERGQWCVLSG
jgi:hypothetical protein